MSTSSNPSVLWGRGAIWFACVLVALELVIISIAYQHNFDFTCRDTAPVWFCAFAGRMVLRALGVLAALSLFMIARRAVIGVLLDIPGPGRTGLALNLAGFALVLLPWFGLSDASPPSLVAMASLSWSLGGLLTVLGLMLILAPVPSWVQLARESGATLVVLLAVGLALPELADTLLPLWSNEWITEITFKAVLFMLGVLGYEVWSDLPSKGIGTQEFAVLVGPQCSGVEGFMLITVFLTIYIGLFWRDLRFPRVLILYPVGLLVSWCFNVLRITVLLVIGFEGQPELAIGAFHSHAGWLSFTLLSVGLVLVSRAVPWFRKDIGGNSLALPPFFRDPAVAQILPFLVFMASALLASTFSETPSLIYPWRMLAVGIVLALVWPWLRSLPWRVDPLAALSGLAIAAMWIATGDAPAEDAALPFAGLTGAALVIWMVVRVIGTTVFVPVLEEIFFRGYLLQRIAPTRQGVQMILAVVISTAAFAVLHDRWLVAAIAGLVFAGLVWRSNNVTDAILSHAVANGAIVAWVLATGAWHII